MSGDSPGVRRLAVLTTGRQDWGILRSTCQAIRDASAIDLDVVAGGMHLSPRHGNTVELVRADGFEPATLAWLDEGGDASEAPSGVPAATQAGRALEQVGAHLRSTRPDAVLLAGDRFETAAAAVAATIEAVPIVHLHGGEQTFGAFDDALRHAVTKLAHLHLVSHPEYADRVIAMGEDPGAVHVVGAPGIDGAFRGDLLDQTELSATLGIELRAPVVLVTVHPATLDADPAAVVEPIVATMTAVRATYVVTMPNVDPGAEHVRAALTRVVHELRGTAVAVDALGDRAYWSLLRTADAMLGNSSSGLVEAPAVGLPVVNVGDRQAGRRREPNVIDVTTDAAAVTDALRRALSPSFRATAEGARPALADGRAGERVAAIIAAWKPPKPPRKPPIGFGR